MKNEDSLEEKISEFYRKILEREPDQNGLEFFTQQIQSNNMHLENVSEIMINSEEYINLQEMKKKLIDYQKLFYKPIFIFGIPRSGTTILYQSMCKMPETIWMSDKDIENWLTIEEQEIIQNFFIQLSKNNKKIPSSEEAIYALGPSSSFGDDYIINGRYPVEGIIFWQRYFGYRYVDDISLKLKIDLLEKLSTLLKENNNRRFLNKNPLHSMRLFSLKKIFPEAKFIHISRDPRAVVYSMMKRAEKEERFLEGIEIKNRAIYEKLDFIQKWAWIYREFIESIQEFVTSYGSDVYNLKYEDFVKNPIMELKKILDFCELDTTESLESIIPPIKQLDNSWEQKFNSDEQRKILEISIPSINQTCYVHSIFSSDSSSKFINQKKEEFDINFFEKKIYSQNGEDGILEFIFNSIGTTNKFFVELGVGDGLECNSRYLLEKGWNGIMIDAVTNNQSAIKKEFITAENVNDILEKYDIPRIFDLLSIDIDYNTYWIWKAISHYIPRVVVIEYNSSVPYNESLVVKYDPVAKWDGTNYFGASLLALFHLGNSMGYTLVGCDSKGINAFFVKNDLLVERKIKKRNVKDLYKPPGYGMIINGVQVGHPISDKSMMAV